MPSGGSSRIWPQVIAMQPLRDDKGALKDYENALVSRLALGNFN